MKYWWAWEQIFKVFLLLMSQLVVARLGLVVQIPSEYRLSRSPHLLWPGLCCWLSWLARLTARWLAPNSLMLSWPLPSLSIAANISCISSRLLATPCSWTQQDAWRYETIELYWRRDLLEIYHCNANVYITIYSYYVINFPREMDVRKRSCMQCITMPGGHSSSRILGSL